MDEIKVRPAIGSSSAIRACEGAGSACLTVGVVTFQDLVGHMVGISCDTGLTGTDGWYRNFSRPW